MSPRKLNLILAAIFAAVSVHAAPLPLNLVDLSKNIKTANVFDMDPSKPVPRKGGMLELKSLQFRRQWTQCRDLAARLQPKFKDVEGWIATVRLECALGAYYDKKDTAGLEHAFDGVRAGLFDDQVWASNLKETWVRAGLILAETAAKKMPALAQKRYENLLERWQLNEEQSSLALTGLGQLALARKDDEQALFYFKQAIEKFPLKEAHAHISEINERLSGPKKEDKEKTEVVTTAIGAEAEAEPEIQKLLADGKRADAMKKSVEILNRFPLGQYSKKNKDRIQETLISAIENGDSDLQLIVDAVKGADASRLVEWAGVLHRRGNDLAALQLAEKAAEMMATSPSNVNALWIAGRSAYFIGDWEKSQIYFDRILQFFSVSDESAEAAFRLGLIQLHLGNYQTATRFFDKVIAMGKPRFDLNARYWRVRAMEKVNAAAAAESRDELIEKFPFTYYGLKLRAEANKGQLEFPKNDRSPLEDKPSKFWLVGSQKNNWNRFKKLSEEGWVIEAQAELKHLPTPADPWSLILWGRMLAKAGQYPTAINVMSRAMDMEETLRHPRYLSEAFPKSYDRWIQESAKKNDLNADLVKSLIRQESAFGLKALSSSSAMGLMQLIPATASEMAHDLKMDVAIPGDMYRPDVNVPMGTGYLAKMLTKYNGNVPIALAAYNAGPKRIDKFLDERQELAALIGKDFSSWDDEIWYDELPTAETSFYVKAILRNLLINRLMDQGPVTVSPSFWSDLRHFSSSKSDDEVKRH